MLVLVVVLVRVLETKIIERINSPINMARTKHKKMQNKSSLSNHSTNYHPQYTHTHIALTTSSHCQQVSMLIGTLICTYNSGSTNCNTNLATNSAIIHCLRQCPLESPLDVKLPIVMVNTLAMM